MAIDYEADCIIVGGGPAGLSCALECTDVRIRPIVLEAGPLIGGQLRITPNPIRNFAAGIFHDGQELRERIQMAVDALSIEVWTHMPAISIDPVAKTVTADGGRQLRGRAIVLATGRRRRSLEVPGAGRFATSITEEILPDRERFAGLSVAVVGGGDSACLDALELAPIAREVHLISRSPALRARTDIQRAVLAEPKIERWSGWEIRALAGTDHLESMTIAEAASRIGGAVTDPTGTRDSAGATGASLLREIAVDAIVVKIGFAPNTEAFRDKIACNEAGEVLADRGGRTNVPGVFAIGDVVAGSVWRVAAAVGSGVTVVPAIQQHLSSLLG